MWDSAAVGEGREYIGVGPPIICIVAKGARHIVTCHVETGLGARVVAVASGFHSIEQLDAHRPDALLSDLCDTERVMDKKTAKETFGKVHIFDSTLRDGAQGRAARVGAGGGGGDFVSDPPNTTFWAQFCH